MSLKLKENERVDLKMIWERFFFSENVRDLTIFTSLGRKLIKMGLAEDKENVREKL